MGKTQYIDAFQRANFWKALGSRASHYHVLFDPVRTVDPILVDVPPNEGVALTDGLVLGPPAICAPVLIVDINWFDSYLNGTIFPALKEPALKEEDDEELGAASLSIFLMYNVWVAAASPVTNFFNCCFNYHSWSGYPTNQMYAVVAFDTSLLFSTTPPFTSPNVVNTLVISHELGEWLNDPFITNGTPPWGPGAFCANKLEVGDPLDFGFVGYISAMPPVVMPNGYSYLLQELTFFSWFQGGPSIGVNGWYSNNATFLTDAGPVCP